MHSNPLDRRALLLAIAGTALAQAQTPAPAPPIFVHDLPDINMHNWQVTAVEINYQPGQSSGPHRHPGITIAYILEGEIRSKIGDGPEKTYGPGQMFIEYPNELHAGSSNPSKTKPAKFIALLLTEKGVPLSKPA